MAVIKAVSSKAGIGQALDYVTKEEKTEDNSLIEQQSQRIAELMKEQEQDSYLIEQQSQKIFLISLAVSVYFAESIRVVIPINLLLLLILVHIVYVLIRWYVKGCKRSRGYY